MLKTLLFLGFSNIAAFVFVTACTSYLLTFYLKADDTNRASTIGLLETADQIVSLVGCPLWGVLSDVWGEKIVCITGIALMSFGLILHPLSTSITPDDILDSFRSLVFSRILFSAGGAASVTMLTAYTGSAAQTRSATRISSYMGISSGLGAVFSAFCLNRLPVVLSGQMNVEKSLLCSFSVMATILMINAGLVVIYFPRRSEKKDPMSKKKDIFTASGPFLSIVSSSIARINTVSPHLFMPLWITDFCRAYRSEQNLFVTSKRLSSSLLGVCQLVALLGAPVIAIFGRRLKPELGITLISSIGAISYLALYFVQMPESVYSYVLVSVLGLVEISSVIISLSLFISSYGSAGKRSGIYGFFGSLGIIFISNTGGLASDTSGRSTPFMIIGLTNLLFSLASFWKMFMKGQ